MDERDCLCQLCGWVPEKDYCDKCKDLCIYCGECDLQNPVEKCV